MKDEFLYTMRMYAILIFSVGDMGKFKELLIDYKFMNNWEEEQALESNKNFRATHESVLTNLLNLIASNDDSDPAAGGGREAEKSKIMRIEKSNS